MPGVIKSLKLGKARGPVDGFHLKPVMLDCSGVFEFARCGNGKLHSIELADEDMESSGWMMRVEHARADAQAAGWNWRKKGYLVHSWGFGEDGAFVLELIGGNLSSPNGANNFVVRGYSRGREISRHFRGSFADVCEMADAWVKEQAAKMLKAPEPEPARGPQLPATPRPSDPEPPADDDVAALSACEALRAEVASFRREVQGVLIALGSDMAFGG